MSGGGGSGTQTTTAEPPAFVKPFSEELLQRAAQISRGQFTRQPVRQPSAQGFGQQQSEFDIPRLRGLLGNTNTIRPGDLERLSDQQVVERARQFGFTELPDVRTGGQGLAPTLTTASDFPDPFAAAVTGEQAIAPLSADEASAFARLRGGELTGSPEFRALSTLAGPQNLEDLIAANQRQTINTFNTEVAPELAGLSTRSGSFGNTGLAELASRERFNVATALGDIGARTRFAGQRQQLEAAGLASTIRGSEIQALAQAGQTQRAVDQAIRDVNTANTIQEQQRALRELELLGQAINITSGGFGTTTTTGGRSSGPNPFIGALGAAGSFAGGLGTLIPALGCWVAREVYGNDNPRWLLFRHWLFNEAPAWFRWAYLKYGERIARFIKGKPLIKRVIRRFMDARINGSRTGRRHSCRSRQSAERRQARAVCQN